jgi:hypothetical protein
VTDGRVQHLTLVVLRGVDPARPVDAVGGTTYTAESWFTPDNPGVTTRTPGALALTAMASGPAARQALETPGWTELAGRDGIYSGEHVHVRTVATPGPTGALTWRSPDATSSYSWFSSISLALRPATT